MNDKRPIRFIVGCGALLMTAIVGGAVLTAFQLHNRILADNERELSNTALILAEHSDRALQTVELIHSSIQERIQSLGIASRLDFAQRMSKEDMHLMLKLECAPYGGQLQAAVLTGCRAWRSSY
jgi:hypothetical protein